jgi:LPS sulfotransferase NodH
MNPRRKEYRRNEDLEGLLRELNELLEPAQQPVLKRQSRPRYPVVLLVGCARAGSTILLQCLSGTGCFAYPTNLISRFYAAPYIGARIQQLLTDSRYNFRDEFADYVPTTTYNSDLGKTRGILAPNEFWYFWRRFFHFGDIQTLTDDELHKVDAGRFVSELAAFEAALDKPVLLKGMIINWIIPFVAHILKKVLFIHVTRDPLYNAQSLLESRLNYFGTIDTWYSFKPPEYRTLKQYSPLTQVAGQVYFTNDAITRGLQAIEPARWMRVSYENFCEDPAAVFNTIGEKFMQQGLVREWRYRGPNHFDHNNRLRLSVEESDAIMRAYADCAHGRLLQHDKKPD